MTSTSPEREHLQSTLTTLRSYLENAGWTTLSVDERGSLWHHADVLRDLVIALPSSAEWRDAQRDLSEAIATLAYAENRSVRELNADIRAGGADSVSVRLVPDAPSGRAPLSLAQDTISALRQFVVASASALINKALVLPNRRPQMAEAYAARAQLATEPGSFVLDLSLPLGTDVADSDSDALVPLSEPFGRRVAMRMQDTAQRALRKAAAISNEDGDISDFGNPGLRLGNATELEALARLGGDALPYQLRFTHSALAPHHQPPRVLGVTRTEQEVLRAASEYLRRFQPQQRVTIEGLVVRLFREKASGPGEVTVSAVLDDSGQEKRCRVSLFEADYAAALSAHEQGLRVRIMGDLTAGTPKRLEHVSSFVVVEDALQD